MSLSRKHYEAFAEILKDERATANLLHQRGAAGDVPHAYACAALSGVEDSLCAYFHQDNPAFNPARFRKAAQP